MNNAVSFTCKFLVPGLFLYYEFEVLNTLC